MGDEFWDAFAEGADAAIGTMGEDVRIRGELVRAVVQSTATHPEAVPGGQSAGVTHVLHLSLADGDGVADGDAVVCRGLAGRVKSKEHFGGGWLVAAGPVNRWDGEV